MSIRRSTLLIALLLAASNGVAQPDEPNPTYQGKPLSLWLESYKPFEHSFSNSLSPELQNADDAVRQAGTNAIPMLLRMIGSHDSTFIPNARAAMAFKNLDPSAQELAMPGLIQVYEQSISTSSHSYEAVIEVWMYSMGLAAKKAIPSLLLGVTNANASVRSQSLSALGRIHSEPAVVVPIFIKSLNDSDATVRWVAAGYLGSHALDARPAVPALIELLKDTNSTGLNLMVRKEATNALKKIDPESAAKAGVK